MQSLNHEQKKKATISNVKRRNNMQSAANLDNVQIEYEGLPVSEMTTQQKQKLLKLIALYVDNVKEGHAKVKMEQVKKHIEKTYFSWIGKTDKDAVFYYRIYSPVVLIEFDHQSPVGVRTGDRNPTKNHIHTIVRTPNGNDYGKDYLQQHLKEHSH